MSVSNRYRFCPASCKFTSRGGASSATPAYFLARLGRVERPTNGFEARYSIQLSYRRVTLLGVCPLLKIFRGPSGRLLRPGYSFSRYLRAEGVHRLGVYENDIGYPDEAEDPAKIWLEHVV